MLSGSLRREEVLARIKLYVTEFNRLYPTKYAKFGNSRLVTLDAVMFEDGSRQGAKPSAVDCGIAKERAGPLGCPGGLVLLSLARPGEEHCSPGSNFIQTSSAEGISLAKEVL